MSFFCTITTGDAQRLLEDIMMHLLYLFSLYLPYSQVLCPNTFQAATSVDTAVQGTNGVASVRLLT